MSDLLTCSIWVKEGGIVTVEPLRFHHLKIHPIYFEAILDGRKTFEIRDCRDREFYVDDHLILQEWDPALEDYTGLETEVVVTWVSHLENLTTAVLAIRSFP